MIRKKKFKLIFSYVECKMNKIKQRHHHYGIRKNNRVKKNSSSTLTSSVCLFNVDDHRIDCQKNYYELKKGIFHLPFIHCIQQQGFFFFISLVFKFTIRFHISTYKQKKKQNLLCSMINDDDFCSCCCLKRPFLNIRTKNWMMMMAITHTHTGQDVLLLMAME